MVITSAIVAGSLVLSSMGPSGSGVARARQVQSLVAVTDSFSPPPRKKRKSSSKSSPKTAPAAGDDTPDDTEQDWTPPATTPARRAPASAPAPRRRAAEPAESAAGAGDDKADDDDEKNGDHDRPKPRRRPVAKKKVVDDDKNNGDDQDDENEDADEPIASMPSVIPRLVWFAAGATALGRTFQYNTNLQKESTFPRPGIALDLEAYPLIRMPRGWYKMFGIGVSYALELGSAALLQTDGSANSFPVKQQRLSIDVRYAFPLGERVVVTPALGYASTLFDLQRMTPIAPSQCTAALTQPCLADVQTSALAADVHVRVAVTTDLAFAASVGYLLGIGLGKNAGQIGSEAGSASWSGFRGDVAASYLVNGWLALRFDVPFLAHSYKFSGGTATYASASESYYGVVLGVAVFTK